MQLYGALHPEDAGITEDELTDITIKNVLTDNIYNDLVFLVGNRLMILLEAQSTWTMNIILRALLYLAQAYHDYFERTKQSLYRSKKVEMPKPELYVIFAGSRKAKPETVFLSKEFFNDEDCCIDVKVKMIYDSRKGDIINQYIAFTKVCDEQIHIYGRTRKAIQETAKEATERKAEKAAIRIIRLGKMSLEDIAECVELTLDAVKALEQQAIEPAP